VIKSFADAATEDFWRTGKGRRLPTTLHRTAKRKLLILDAATQLIDLAVPPGNHLERLHGDRKGQHSIRINDRYRVCFVWKQDDAYEVEIVDYH
jgi:proteic killer suppression protein